MKPIAIATMPSGTAWVLALSTATCLYAGCVDDARPAPGGPESVPGTASGALALTLELPAASDVAGFAFRAEPVDCASGAPSGDTTHDVTWAPLAEMTVEHLARGHLTPATPVEHLTIAHTLALDAGCYDLSAVPMADARAPSAQCAPARTLAVRVDAQAPATAVLASRCDGGETDFGAAETALNHAPHLGALSLAPAPQPGEACAEQTLCASARDPDGDPLAFDWPEGAQPTLEPQLGADGGWTACARLAPPATASALTLHVRDLMTDEDGAVIAIEDFLRRSDPTAVSHDTLGLALDGEVLCAAALAL